MLKLVPPAILTLFLIFGCGDEVAVENQKWTYEDGACSVTLKLKNHGYDTVDRKVTIVAHKLRDIGDGAIGDDIIGEKTTIVRLKPHEEKELLEIVALNPRRRPDMVVVSHFETK